MSRQRVEAAVNAAEKLNDTLNAFLAIDREGAFQRTENTSGPLAGIPVAVKDNLCVIGMQASCGSRILGDYHPPYNATVIQRLIDAGAIIIGKTNCDEFAMGSMKMRCDEESVGCDSRVRRPRADQPQPFAAGIVPVALDQTLADQSDSQLPVRRSRSETHLRA